MAEHIAPPSWRTVEIVSDLHLHADAHATLALWRSYLQHSRADAIFILGDLFEVWVGDDAAARPGFEADCARDLRAAANARPLFFMHGNRDFLVGTAFARQAGLTLLADPTVLVFAGQRWLLSHGDALCLSDPSYQKFRAWVRLRASQQAFLTLPLFARRYLARRARERSQSHQKYLMAEAASAIQTEAQTQTADAAMAWGDVDTPAARSWLEQASAKVLIHGHTHRPARHALDAQRERIVLGDWDGRAPHPRARALRLSAEGAAYIDLADPDGRP
jgi:UDP-2,3-diacylglucosamine hydrolase